MKNIMFLVIENDDAKWLENANPAYRAMAIRGSTYTEAQFRIWAADTFAGRFKVSYSSPIAKLAKACAKGGWKVIQMVIY